MEFWIVIEEVHNQVHVQAFDCLSMARDYAKNQCHGAVRIERHIMNMSSSLTGHHVYHHTGWQGLEKLEEEN